MSKSILMTFSTKAIVMLLCCLASVSCHTVKNDKWHPLLIEAGLVGWDTYLGPGYKNPQTKGELPLLGLNNDPNKVFSIINEDGKPTLRISGETFGGISTKQAFENYHLRLEFKWGKLKWPPKEKDKRDSGLLYHAVGPHGADGGFWMRSQEFQLQEGDCGDYWGVAGGIFDIQARLNGDSTYIFDEKGQLLTFSAKSTVGRRCRKYPDAEKPSGEWNTIDLYCLGDTSVHMVNGVVTMILYHSRQQEQERQIPLTKGKIQIQSEGAEVFYRHIQVRSIKKIPDIIFKQSAS